MAVIGCLRAGLIAMSQIRRGGERQLIRLRCASQSDLEYLKYIATRGHYIIIVIVCEDEDFNVICKVFYF